MSMERTSSIFPPHPNLLPSGEKELLAPSFSKRELNKTMFS
jgi:hypothetical protein